MKTYKAHSLILVLVWQRVYTHAKSDCDNEAGEETAFGTEMFNLQQPAHQ